MRLKVNSQIFLGIFSTVSTDLKLKLAIVNLLRNPTWKRKVIAKKMTGNQVIFRKEKDRQVAIQVPNPKKD